ncbi:hypothetical protein BO78DRAFT_133599 [Aspergillus sclerotiicarbonarius CBS 121057]|uniref:Uncharacterized protein n=1 Tax=Aspergillus sclerotiicarbonarius (strain CBS 121057 / IBT 28362) TaxID=1448318 RepID=A0A319EUM9_ASPSB|nr:hypothetical protein BO78DRAFT_133599 [Aspergillus sclerotiicarbonarius CBS 121057]
MRDIDVIGRGSAYHRSRVIIPRECHVTADSSHVMVAFLRSGFIPSSSTISRREWFPSNVIKSHRDSRHLSYISSSLPIHRSSTGPQQTHRKRGTTS